MKRIGDLLIAFILIAVCLPLMAIVALALKLDSPGPIFSSQEGLDLGGRRVRILKFRTTACRSRDPERIVVHDAHLTRVGWLLRCTHIDSLPQLMNVVRGELTLIDAGRKRPAFFGWR